MKGLNLQKTQERLIYLEERLDELEETNNILERKNKELVESYKKDTAFLKEICSQIKVDADLHFYGNNTVIFTGSIKGRPFVKFYDLGDYDFEHCVSFIREKSKQGCQIRHIDAPPNAEPFIKRKLNGFLC